MDYKLDNNTLELLIDNAIYSEDVVFKSFYWLTGNYDISVQTSTINESFYLVKLVPKDINQSAIDDQLIGRIKRDLVDFKLRDIVTKETKTIRELITAKAFAYYDLDEPPATEVSDPVGFNPSLF